MTACPCNPANRYVDCCGRWHAGAVVDSAEALMRSRYSAYVLGDVAYLRATWHSGTRPSLAALQPDPETRWLGLAVRRHAQTGADTAAVEFVARCKVGGAPAVRLHEISRFVREHGRWYYLDGEFPAR